jgi:hypothetical protein
MSDEPFDVDELQKRAEREGIKLSPEFLSELRRKIQNEQDQLKKLREQGSSTTIEEVDWFKRVRELVEQDQQKEKEHDRDLAGQRLRRLKGST